MCEKIFTFLFCFLLQRMVEMEKKHLKRKPEMNEIKNYDSDKKKKKSEIKHSHQNGQNIFKNIRKIF